MLHPRVRLVLALATAAGLVSIAAVVAREANPARRVDPSTETAPVATCASLASEPRTAFVPGLLHEGRSTYTHAKRNVTTDRSTILSGLALAQAQGERVDASALTSWTFERDEVCTFNLTRVLTINGALEALALGIRESAVPPNATIVVAFHTSAFRNVTLDQNNTLAALALARAGERVNLSDVASIEEGNTTTRTFSRVVDADQQQTAISLALMPQRTDAPPMPRTPAPDITPSPTNDSAPAPAAPTSAPAPAAPTSAPAPPPVPASPPSPPLIPVTNTSAPAPPPRAPTKLTDILRS